ncbi:hypothetical protein Pla86_52630 (plasmid) [Planctomycetes bacterium Pla86]|uniref:Uncharacterized protein n=1 Tax=Engelhardtia mirabilis TaxID=2528011 RepID=A0A518BT48_9BACT|nr:hypothetical protein Pla133_52630 [Planctomycetes bacterium Pla133]QDV04467.1 hypothetical protein Pla86_52630 [Planctomycetes bacterium Pla86]
MARRRKRGARGRRSHGLLDSHDLESARECVIAEANAELEYVGPPLNWPYGPNTELGRDSSPSEILDWIGAFRDSLSDIFERLCDGFMGTPEQAREFYESSAVTSLLASSSRALRLHRQAKLLARTGAR